MSSICFDNRNELFGTGLRGETHQKKKNVFKNEFFSDSNYFLSS